MVADGGKGTHGGSSYKCNYTTNPRHDVIPRETSERLLAIEQ